MRTVCVLIVGLLWGWLTAQADWTAVAQRAQSSVVKVIALTSGGESSGTGFAVAADGIIATNQHVIEGATKIFVSLSDGKRYEVSRIVAQDRRLDLAILQVRGLSLPPLALDDGSAVQVGLEICVMGAPLGLDQSFSTGVVSAKRVLDGYEWIQFTAPISPGSSGSPVMTRAGTVIGVVTFTLTRGQNVNFASSAKYLRVLLNNQKIQTLPPQPIPTHTFPKPPSTPQPPIAPQTPQEPPSRLVVSNATELVQAIKLIKSGGEIVLQPGEYRLREPLVIRKPLLLAGAGKEKTTIVYEGSRDFVILYDGDGILSIRDATLRYSGSADVSFVITAFGELSLTRCLIAGGVGIGEKSVGHGIGIGAAQAVISECEITDNEAGVVVAEDASMRIESCVIHNNAKVGLAVLGSCVVRNTEFKRNKLRGIAIVGSKAKLTARNNLCEDNEEEGIVLLYGAYGELEGNICRNNGSYGISVLQQSRIVARNNTCEANQWTGIALFDDAQGELIRNICRNNNSCGIYAGNQARLTARNNICEGNRDTGIALYDSAQGELEENICRNNDADGIEAVGQSRLTARKNTCEENKESGIAIFDKAQATLERNACRKNQQHGIFAGEQSRLVARSNTCEGNQWDGIRLFDSAQGEAIENTCRNNNAHGIDAGEQPVLSRATIPAREIGGTVSDFSVALMLRQ
jgi:parallel beta-helix repeat protein